MEHSTLIDLLALLVENDKKLDPKSYIPIIHSREGKKLVASIKVQNAFEYLAFEGEIIQENIQRGKNCNDQRYQLFFRDLGINHAMPVYTSLNSLPFRERLQTLLEILAKSA